MDSFCPETGVLYGFFGCNFHGHTCEPFPDVIAMNGDTLAEREERTMARIEEFARALYKVEVQWEYEFDEEILSRHPELKTHPLVRHSPLNTRDTLYGYEPMP